MKLKKKFIPIRIFNSFEKFMSTLTKVWFISWSTSYVLVIYGVKYAEIKYQTMF